MSFNLTLKKEESNVNIEKEVINLLEDKMPLGY